MVWWTHKLLRRLKFIWQFVLDLKVAMSYAQSFGLTLTLFVIWLRIDLWRFDNIIEVMLGVMSSMISGHFLWLRSLSLLKSLSDCNVLEIYFSSIFNFLKILSFINVVSNYSLSFTSLFDLVFLRLYAFHLIQIAFLNLVLEHYMRLLRTVWLISSKWAIRLTLVCLYIY